MPSTHDVAAFAQAIRAIGEPIHGQPAETISMARLLTLLFEVTELFDMQARPELMLLQKTMVVVEGVARTLDPAFNMWKTAEPVVGDWIAGNLGPRGLLADARDGANALFSLARQAPEFAKRDRAAVARDRRDGRARPALRRCDGERDRQGRGPPHPLRPHRAVGYRADADLDRLASALSRQMHAMLALHALLFEPIFWRGEEAMATLTIRNLDENVKRELRKRAAESGVSMEQEARDRLAESVNAAGRQPSDPCRRQTGLNRAEEVGRPQEVPSARRRRTKGRQLA